MYLYLVFTVLCFVKKTVDLSHWSVTAAGGGVPVYQVYYLSY